MAIPVSALILSAQRAADMVNSGFVDTPTWIDWCDQAHKQLYGKVFQQFKDTFFKSTDFSMVNGTNQQTLPADFRMLRGFEQDPTLAIRRNVPKFNFTDRNKYRSGTIGAFNPQSQQKGYRVVARSTLLVEPPENCAGNYRLYYVNGPVTLTATTDDIMVELEPWSEYISQAMARKALLKEESDVTAVDERMAEIVADLQVETETDEGEQDSVVDVEADSQSILSLRVW